MPSKRPIGLAFGALPAKKLVTGTTTLKAWERHVECTPHTSTTYTVTLPPCEEVPECFFYILGGTGATGDVTIASAAGATVGTLTATADHMLLYSTGYAWVAVLDVTT